jgi:hypothetical protein
MYKCLNCGEVFEEPASVRETHGFTDGFAETFYMCPYCNGDYEKAKQCRECYEWHAENELYDGWCEDCLRETINYDTFFDYCEANKDRQYLDIFVMQELLDTNCPDNVSYDFHQLMIDVYKARVEAIKAAMTEECKKCIDILPACIRFIMDDDGSIGRENYADWLNSKKEVK